MSHELKNEYGGHGMEGWIRPTCSCGWKGIQHYAWDDYQHMNARDEGQRHLRDSKKEQSNVQ